MIDKGDKVRFIDEALEGTVSSLIGKDRAEVITTDGFSMIAPLKQLVKVRPETEEKSMIAQAPSQVLPVKQPEQPVRLKKLAGKIFSFDETNNKEEIVYAAFELIDPASPMTSALQLHLVNNTNQKIAFSLSRKFEMRDEGIAADTMEHRSFKSFITCTQEELKLFESFRIQLIFHSTGKTIFRPPVQKQFRFNAEDILESNDFIFEKTNCLLVQLADLTQAPEIDITQLVSKYADSVKEENFRKDKTTTTSTSRTVIHTEEKVVDLHIEELLKDFSGMSNGQIIAHQLKSFQYEMDRAMVNHLRKITFIHGVGAGVLRSAIREELKKYPNIKFDDAPSEKFGYGATEIVFD